MKASPDQSFKERRAARAWAALRRRLAAAVVAVTTAAAAAPPAAHAGTGGRGASKALARSVAARGKGEARVAIGIAGVLRQVEAKGRRTETRSLEEDVAHRIEELLRGPLRVGTTGIYVADARTGQPVFAVHPDDALNPASNVKLLSTAAAMDALGPTFRYQTRVLGPVPDRNVVHGDVYLLGSFDPTLGSAGLAELASELAAAGVTRIDGDVVIGPSPTRDGVYRALLPVQITAGAEGAPPAVTLPVGYDYVSVHVTATTVSGKKARRARLSYAEAVQLQPAATPSTLPGAAPNVGVGAAPSVGAGAGPSLGAAQGTGGDAAPPRPAAPSTPGKEAELGPGARLQLTVSGTIGAGRSFTHWLWVRDRGRHAGHLLRAALAEQGVAISGDVRKAELPAYLFERVRAGSLPVVLARHHSAPLAQIVASINKRSINWLADRVLMTAAALKYGELPSMQRGVDAMYEWLDSKLRLGRREVLVDTGSGLSRKTQLSPRHIAEVLRAAGGFADGEEASAPHRAWLDSLALSDGGVQDGTLRGRFRGTGFSGRLRGKTGTLSTSIALSGVLESDPQRPLVFSIVTNSATPLPKSRVRAGHDRIVALLAQYAARRPGAAAGASPAPAPAPAARDAELGPEPGEAGDEELDEPAAELSPRGGGPASAR